MNNRTDQQLLRDYAKRRSEAAFSELVRRHVDFVYSAALRMVRDAHAAQDVTQGVFVALAKSARQLVDRPILSGWLHRTTQNLAANSVRADVRRRIREQEAAAMNELLADSGTGVPPVWSEIAPHLDAALTELNEPDRDALLLRYFEGKSAREMAQTLGISDEAAQKRVNRAVERLRDLFVKRGLSVGASGLVIALSTHAVQAAPAGLALAISSAAFASMASTGTLTLLKIMTATKLKLGAGAIIIAGVLILLVMQRQEKSSSAQGDAAEPSGASTALESVSAPHNRLPSANRSSREPDISPTVSPEEIVAGRLVQFAQSRRELVRALAQRNGIQLPDAIEQFYDAIEGGRWEEADAIFKSLRYDDKNNGNPRSPELNPIWRPIQETWGIARETRNWPAQKLLEYGETVLGSLRPGMIYVGGTDPGCFIPTMLNETSEGERHIVMTQNALANGPYLDYLNDLYGDRLATLTQDDSRRAFADYLADYQKRLTHDMQFPDEPKQVRPGENITGVEPGEGVTIDPDKVRASGIDAVMAMNERLFRMLMEKNPDMSFAMEVSWPFRSMYADAAPLGPLIELRVQDEQNALSYERALQTVDYWRTTAETMASYPHAAESLFDRYAYGKMAIEQAELLFNRGYAAEAEHTFRLANEIAPGPESLSRLVNLLKAQGRLDEALSAAENTLRLLPPDEHVRRVFGDKADFEGQIRNAMEELKRTQK